jgi:hypothetical protein
VEIDVKNRINKARSAFGIFLKVYLSNQINLPTNIKIFNSNIKSVLTYAFETWKVKVAITNQLQTYINKCLRYILRVRWPEKISNTEIYKITNQMPVCTEIKRRKWRWIRHTLRKPDEIIAKQCFKWNAQGRRRAGRPRNTWRRTVIKKAAAQNNRIVSFSELIPIAKDRTKWKRFVDALCPI